VLPIFWIIGALIPPDAERGTVVRGIEMGFGVICR
jgi:hypothetical protein